MAARYFHLQIACGIIALLHVTAEWLYLGKSTRKLWLGLLVGLWLLGLVGGFGLQPRLKQRATAQKLAGVISS